MECVEPKSHSWWWDSHISPENCKWLAENLQGVDQSVKQLMKLVEEDENHKRPELIAHIEELCCMHRLLAERYDLLTGELRRNIPSLLQMQHPGISDSQASPLLTPNQKLGLHKSEQAVGFDLFLSSGGGSSEISLKEGSSSSSSLSSDSDSDSFLSINKRSVASLDGNDKVLHQKVVEKETEFLGMEEKIQVTKQESVNGTMKVRETGGHGVLFRRIMDCEEELRVSNKKLQFSEEEIARLKCELNKKESVTKLMGNMQAQIETAQYDIKMREANLEIEERKVLELQKQVTELEAQICDSDCKIGSLEEELNMTRGKQWVSDEEIEKLKHGLSNKISEGTHQSQGQLELAQRDISLLETKLDAEKGHVLELQAETLRYIADVSDRDHEIRELNAALHDVEEKFSVEKAKLQSDISSLLKEQILLKDKIGGWELERRSLEYENEQCKAEKLEMKGLHEAQEIRWQADIEQLKAELEEKSELVETLNKTIDMLKLKYDMLMAEKDGVNAKVDTLNAELSHQDNKIRQMEGHQHQLHLEHVELINGCESARKLTDELRLKVEELEKEVDKQRAVISDRAEEKREAIRQLCFSLEHYRSGYQELRQAYFGHKRRVVLAS